MHDADSQDSVALQDHAAKQSVPFESQVELMEELWQQIASYCADDAETLLCLSSVSVKLRSAILGTQDIWKSACEYRWKAKWGFNQRWKAAIHDEQRQRDGDDAMKGRWWRHRYYWQEQDALRSSIRPEELQHLVFDFRFWLSQTLNASNFLRSGLTSTQSQSVQFLQSNTASGNYRTIGGYLVMAHGVLRGHPSYREDLEWFLIEGGRSLQWGRRPHLWPEGRVQRLDTWGWEIRNPNVCMRAIDIDNDHRHDVLNDRLWNDYMAGLELVPTDFGSGHPSDHNDIIYLEVPKVFWEFPLNQRRYPPKG